MPENEVVGIASAIHEFGGFAVILAVFIVVFMIIIKSNAKSLAAFQEQLLISSQASSEATMEIVKASSEANAKLLQQLIEQLITNQDTQQIIPQQQNAKTTDTDLMQIFTKLSTSMKDFFRDSLSVIKADRLALYLFHNGMHSTSGVRFLKVSCISENVRIGSGVREHMIDHSNIPINLFDEAIKCLVDNGVYVAHNGNDSCNTAASKIFISAEKIKYSIAVSIFDTNNNILGFVLCEYSTDYDQQKYDEVVKELKRLVIQVSPILSYADYVPTNIAKNNES